MYWQFFYIFAIFVEFSLSSPLSDETTTEHFEIPQTTSKVTGISSILSKSPKLDEKLQKIEDETFQIQTGKIFEIFFSVSGDWSHEFVDKNSAKFKSFRDFLDMELREIIQQDIHAEIPSGTFRLVNVLPSNLKNFLYVMVLMEAENEKIAEEWKDAIEGQLIIYDKLRLSETPAKVHGDLNMRKVHENEIQFLEINQIECGSGELRNYLAFMTENFLKQCRSSNQLF